jgi:hypothetical protein
VDPKSAVRGPKVRVSNTTSTGAKTKKEQTQAARILSFCPKENRVLFLHISSTEFCKMNMKKLVTEKLNTVATAIKKNVSDPQADSGNQEIKKETTVVFV